MKKKWLLMMMLLMATYSYAQNQIAVYLQQIAANQVLIGYLQDGYKIAKVGLTTIGDLKNGEFHLHTDFFQSLVSINPRIRNLAQVADIVAMQVQVTRKASLQRQWIADAVYFTAPERRYFLQVLDHLLTEVLHTGDELLKVITAGPYQMCDDERIRRINSLQAVMQRNRLFSETFHHDLQVMAINRQQEQQAIEQLKQISK